MAPGRLRFPPGPVPMFPDLQKRFPRLGRAEKLFLSLLALSALASAGERLTGRPLPGLGLLQLACYLAGAAAAAKLLRIAVRKLLWRVRNRMIVLFLFIGFVPLLLATALAGLVGYILIGQVAVYMATTELDRRASRLHGTAAALAWSLDAAGSDRRPRLARSFLEHLSQTWPGLEARVRDREHTFVFPSGASVDPPRGDPRDLRRIVTRGGVFYLMAHASTSPALIGVEPSSPGSVIDPRPAAAKEHAAPRQISGPPDGVEVTLLQPLDEPYLAGLAPGLGRIVFQTWRAAPRRSGGPEWKPARRLAVESPVPIPPPAHRFDYDVKWGTLPFPVDHWGEGDSDTDVNILIYTRPSAVYRLLFGRRVELAGIVTVGLVVLGTLFLIAELTSIVVGVSITRTLTSSVHQLYEATQRVNQGDFSHRIKIQGSDQLAELSRSFNNMTESIERLIEESKERQRLASELAIAREVQEQLFPKAPPTMRGLEVLGVCHPARTVSGDYFDFVKLGEDRLALAIGDVAGKGISGALLMASIQSMLHTQLSISGAAAAPGGDAWRFPAAELVSKLNIQLYNNTAPEKYATFFFGAYDDRCGLLTYTNAGHLPPVLIRSGEPRRLDVNGMVVGAFPFARYEQSEIELRSGDLMVAFTDGVTEPENEFAEEFGEDRLIELLVRNWRRPTREIIEETIRAVSQWTGGRPELQDDMTLLVARRL
jgi:sigma-B regulation protein RsbU (phosphoserine phosphatase)